MSPVTISSSSFADVLDQSKKTAKAWQSPDADWQRRLREGGAPDESVRETCDWVARNVLELIGDLKDAHTTALREQAKANDARMQLKLAQQRTASAVTMKDNIAQVEHRIKQDSEDRMRALINGGGEALQDAYRQLEAATEESAELKIKLEGTEEGLSLATQRTKDSEAHAARVEADAAVLEKALAICAETLSDEAFATMGLKASVHVRSDQHPVVARLEVRITTCTSSPSHMPNLNYLALTATLATQVLTATFAKRHGELEVLKPALKAGLAEVGVHVQTRQTFCEQVQQLLTASAEVRARIEAEKAQAARACEEAQAEAKQAVLDRERLEGERDELQRECDQLAGLQVQIDELSKKVAASAERERLAIEKVHKQVENAMNRLQSAYDATVAKLAELEAKHASSVEELAAALEKVASLQNAQEELDRMEAECVALREAREQSLSELAAKTEEATALAKLTKELQRDEAKTKREMQALAHERDELARRVAEAEEQLAEANEQLEQFTNGTGNPLETMMKRWKSEAEKHKKVVDTCKGMLVNAPKSSSGRPTGKSAMALPLGDLVSSLLDSILGLEWQCEQAQKKVGEFNDTLSTVRSQLAASEAKGESQLEGVIEAAKAERAELVRTALGSLQQLRSHLASELSRNLGLQSSADASRDAREGAEAAVADVELVFNQFKHRWGVQSCGAFDSLTVKLEVPNIHGHTSPGGRRKAGIEPEMQTRLLRLHHPARPHPPTELLLHTKGGPSGRVSPSQASARLSPPVDGSLPRLSATSEHSSNGSVGLASPSQYLLRNSNLSLPSPPGGSPDASPSSSPRSPRRVRAPRLHGGALSQAYAQHARTDAADGSQTSRSWS